MRRSGSSSCMLKPKGEEDQGEALSVTVINNKPLPKYSTERFYMLSEIEQNASRISFLNDYDCDDTAETESESDIDDSPFSSDIILYILWRPGMVSSPKALAQGIIQKSINQVRDATKPRSINLYLVVETLVPEQNDDQELSESEKQKRQQNLYCHQVDVAEQLVRCITRNKFLRDELQGITVGICDHVRAAPGLEACMDGIMVGSRDRRKNGGKSNIGLVTLQHGDLIGLADGETDAAQGVLQSITCCEWNGNGDLNTFAKRAHIRWCKTNEVEVKEERPKRNKFMSLRRRQRGGQQTDFDRNDDIWSDPISLILWAVVGAWLYTQILASSEDGFKELRNHFWSFFLSTNETVVQDEIKDQL